MGILWKKPGYVCIYVTSIFYLFALFSVDFDTPKKREDASVIVLRRGGIKHETHSWDALCPRRARGLHVVYICRESRTRIHSSHPSHAQPNQSVPALRPLVPLHSSAVQPDQRFSAGPSAVVCRGSFARQLPLPCGFRCLAKQNRSYIYISQFRGFSTLDGTATQLEPIPPLPQQAAPHPALASAAQDADIHLDDPVDSAVVSMCAVRADLGE